MVSRKRTRSDAEGATEEQQQQQQRQLEESEEPHDDQPGLLQRIRNCWEFANLMQYIHLFGKLMKIDEEFDIDDLEDECLKPGVASEKLLEIGLCLLKWVSSHRGLTTENFDEYTRRQYDAKAPHLPNPFGYDEVPNKFVELDVFQKLKVLHQLSIWTFWNPDRIREKMPEQREMDQTQWRIEEVGYDRHGRLYYVLDDNRLYRRTDPPIPTARPAKSKKSRKSARSKRSSKRRKVTSGAAAENDSEEEKDMNGDEFTDAGPTVEFKWECLAITLGEYQSFIETLMKTKDADEKILRDRLIEQVLPVIEKAEASQERKRMKRERELFNMQLLAGAKRSSRIAQKAEKERHEREAAEAARKRQADLALARRDQNKVKQMEEERHSRVMTRERRLKDREQKRLLHEAELERIAEEQEKLDRGEGRVSERQLKAELEKQKKHLEELDQEDEWIFDCSGCGIHGENLDDGSHSVACETCNVWQHSTCLGITQEEAERENFHFVCRDCKRREEEAKLPKLPPLKFRLGSSASPPSATMPPAGTTPAYSDDQGSPSKRVKSEVSLGNDELARAPSKAAVVGITAPGQLPQSQTLPPPVTARTEFHVPSSPERRPQNHTGARAHQFGSSPPRAPFSPSKPLNGLAPSPVDQHSASGFNQPSFGSNYQLSGRESFSNGSFQTHRPSSSHSVHSSTLPSPIQNRPSMSPTQGNHDVGPLAGIPPPPSYSNGSTSRIPPFGNETPRSESGQLPPMDTLRRSFSGAGATPSGASQIRSSPPPSLASQSFTLSGLSPTKNTTPRPMTSGSLVGAPVLPPIHKLEPSPKLMGRRSPDAPIPPPVKCMTPEQEERRRREKALMLQSGSGAAAAGQGQTAHGQSSLMSSPSLNRVPPVGSSNLNHQSRP